MKNNHEPLFHVVKRDELSRGKGILIRVVAIIVALIICGIITVALTGVNPISVYGTMVTGAFGSVRKTWVTLQNTAILLLIALALTPAFRMKFWNCGGEGQILVGGLASAACMITARGCTAWRSTAGRWKASSRPELLTSWRTPGGECWSR